MLFFSVQSSFANNAEFLELLKNRNVDIFCDWSQHSRLVDDAFHDQVGGDSCGVSNGLKPR